MTKNSLYAFLLVLPIELYFGRGLSASPWMDSFAPTTPLFPSWSNIRCKPGHSHVMSNTGISHLPPFKHGQVAPNGHASSPKLLLGQVIKPVLRCSCPSSVMLLNAYPTSVRLVHRTLRVEGPQTEVAKAKGRVLYSSLNTVLLRGPLLIGRHLHLGALNW